MDGTVVDEKHDAATGEAIRCNFLERARSDGPISLALNFEVARPGPNDFDFARETQCGRVVRGPCGQIGAKQRHDGLARRKGLRAGIFEVRWNEMLSELFNDVSLQLQVIA